MNNEQFRRLLLANSAKSSGNGSAGRSTSPSSHGGLSALGSRQKSSIPMTPRSVGGAGRVDFGRQLGERNQANQKQRKFRTSAPKGSKLAEGYLDRVRTREEEEEDDRAARLKALEESLKKEEIDQATYEKLRFEIAGGDLSSTHLVKGLDFKLLERIRKGEDVYNEKKSAERQGNPEPESEPEEDVDDELERMEESEVHAIAKEKILKKGQLSTAALAPGKKRTRDQILAEMKAARQAAKAKEESALGTKFKKIGATKTAGPRIERDSRGREVLIIVDEDGHEKRKVRKIDVDDFKEREAFVPAKNAEVLGMEVPEFYRKKQQEEAEKEAAKEVDIFDDVGADYDPLAGLDSDSNESDSEEEKAALKASASETSESMDKEAITTPPSKAMPPPPKPQVPLGPRNYFKDSRFGLASEESRSAPSLSDPAVMAALRKAKALNAATKTEEQDKDAKREQRLKKMLQNSDRDAEDLDMGFGANGLEDEEDFEESRIKLSRWGDEDDGGRSGGGKSKRRRGPKKRKGDANSAADVMRIIERRKAADS